MIKYKQKFFQKAPHYAPDQQENSGKITMFFSAQLDSFSECTEQFTLLGSGHRKQYSTPVRFNEHSLVLLLSCVENSQGFKKSHSVAQYCMACFATFDVFFTGTILGTSKVKLFNPSLYDESPFLLTSFVRCELLNLLKLKITVSLLTIEYIHAPFIWVLPQSSLLCKSTLTSLLIRTLYC